MLCPICNHTNRETGDFCEGCGQALSERNQKDNVAWIIEEERRYVTVLFSDLTGYSKLFEHRDPEKVKELTQTIFGAVSLIVSKYHGFIEQVIGDEVMVLFGVPKSREDDCARAVRAAMEIHAAVKALGTERNENPTALTMHTGIDTGLVVTGKTILDTATDGFSGPAIHFAAHLAKLARPDQVLVGHETFRRTRYGFNYRGLKSIVLEGREEAVQIYELLSKPSCGLPAQPDGVSHAKGGQGVQEYVNKKRAGSEILSERKNVTVLISALSGYTEMMEHLDPEEVKELTSRIFSEIAGVIAKYEGFIERVLGAEMLAFFGVPKTHEDDPVRAIQAAREIHAVIDAMNLELEKKGRTALRLHTGINTGLVVTGKTDVKKGLDGFAGQTINIAARLKSLAMPGEILIGQDTYRNADGYFIFKLLTSQTVKGQHEPITIHRVIATRTGRTKFDVSVDRGLTPYVGRKRELELLSDSFRHLKAGRFQAISIVSEAGMGKSRLLYEFKKAVAHANVTFFEGKCLSYRKNTAYFPIIDILKSSFDIQNSDPSTERKRKVEKGLKILGIDDALTSLFLLELLSIRAGGIDKISVSPEVKKDRMVEALKRITVRGSKLQPLVIAIEDLHWMDNSSEDCIGNMLNSITDTNVLAIFTYRPDFVPQWVDQSFCCQINLNRLTDREIRTMASNLLGSREMEPRLEKLVLEKADGNPFFIEEFLKSLSEGKSIEIRDDRVYLSKELQAEYIPSAIQDVIMARMDSLPGDARDLLQKSSVAGREFSHALIETVSGLSKEALLTNMAILKNAGFLYKNALYPQSKYVFRHSLTQEVAYAGLLLKTRKKVHAKVGKAIEELYHERLNEYYEILAHHYSGSDNLEKAYQYLVLSGNKAALSYANREAFRFYKAAVGVLDKMVENENNQKRKIEVLYLSVAPMIRLGYPEGSLQMLKDGERLSKNLKDERSLAKFYDIIGNYYTAKGGNPLLGIEFSEKCFYVTEKIQDFEIMAKVARGLCGAYIVVGEPLKSANLAAKVIDILENTNSRHEFTGRESGGVAVLYALHGHSLGWLGNFDDGIRIGEKALRLGCHNTNLYDRAYINFLCGYLFMFRGDGKKAIEHFQNCIRYCKEGETVMWLGLGWSGLGIGYYFLGDLDLAYKHMEKGIKIQQKSAIPYYMSFQHLASSLVSFDTGDIYNAGSFAGEALKLSVKYNEKWIEAMARILIGSVLVKTDMTQAEKAIDSIRRGIEILDQRSIKPWSSVGHYFLGKLYADTGIFKKAVENLKKAEGSFKEMGMVFWLSRTQKALQQL
jgi:class 3 adenylate cyclase/tetratricopeptide (TPR) repeat protein